MQTPESTLIRESLCAWSCTYWIMDTDLLGRKYSALDLLGMMCPGLVVFLATHVTALSISKDHKKCSFGPLAFPFHGLHLQLQQPPFSSIQHVPWSYPRMETAEITTICVWIPFSFTPKAIHDWLTTSFSLAQESSNFFWKGPEGNVWGFMNHMVSVTMTHPGLCSGKVANNM